MDLPPVSRSEIVMHRRLLASLVFVIAVFQAGCARPRGTVSGEVTLDGRPLEKGVITFAPIDGDPAQVKVEIKDGKYTLTTPPGNKRVSISSYKVTGKEKVYPDPNSPERDVLSEALPERYNKKSELTAEVKKGNNTFNWELKSE
jgi:hypothetical protein